ncbi:hypothetical protein RF11_12788 [Thelohanellus kitauei]|uniref:Uncharacterized protein n=1 Tax=Thelohanellus kitauei TaxID=669202 RepID=A0A0C2MAL4_THEKT|nr:hypothetical protein RF11_12788 [Thelohanellus kitauei]
MKKMIFKMVVLEGQEVTAVSGILDIPRTTIQTALKKIQPDITIIESRRGCTTVPKLTPKIERQITQLVDDNCTMTTLDIIEKIIITVNEKTWKMTRPVTILRNDPTVKSERKVFVEWYQSYSGARCQFFHIQRVPHKNTRNPWKGKIPFLNPCEEAFSLIINQVRRDSRPTGANDLIQRMRSACTTVTSSQLFGFFLHSESFSNMYLNEEDIPRN